ncbi:MAG: pilus assembly protein PilM [Limnochordia bacterium]|nr:pilus assembly protein PilM [Limnochordia bacterium]
MAKKVLGIDIDVSGIKIAEISRKGRSNVVSNLGVMLLPPGTIKDGRVVNKSNLAKGLQDLLKKHDFSATSAVLGLRSSWVTVKTHKFPVMSERELDKALEFEVPELVSFPVQSLKDVYYDYFLSSKSDNELEVVVVACPRQNALPYMEAIRESGLALEAIDVPAFGWAGLLESAGRRVFMEISAEQTTIFVASGGVFKVHRVVPIGAIQFRQGVEETFECSAEEAMALCKDQDLDYLLLEGTGNKRVLRATVQQFIGSVLQTLDFARAQERAARLSTMLDELILLGDLADLRGLDDLLQKEVDLPVRALRQMDRLSLTFETQKPGRFSCYGSALALGLRGVS